MEIYLKRTAKRPGYTIGRLYINNMNGEPLCNTLEPQWRDYAHGEKKIKGHSAIPEGRYQVIMNFSFKKQRILPLLLDVPMFQGLRIHSGTTAKDTEGCILLGENQSKGMVFKSRYWVAQLMNLIDDAKVRGERVWITIE